MPIFCLTNHKLQGGHLSTLNQRTPTSTSPRMPATNTLLHLAQNALSDKKAENIATIPLPADAIADHLIICTATSARHAATLVDAVTIALREAGDPALGAEGKEGSDWLIVDAGDFMVHVMTEDARQTYNLEKLWTPAFEGEETEGASQQKAV